MAMNPSRNRGLLRCRLAIGQSGQSLLELALVTPLLLAMVLGAIEIGRYAFLSILVADAAHAGALYGAQNNGTAADTTGITKAADNDYQNNGQSVSTLTVTSWQSCGCDSGGTYTEIANSKSPNNSAACTTTYVDPTTACGTTGAEQSEWTVVVYVEATATYQALFNYPWIPKSITITRTVEMRVEQ
jgi:Flp pilus assembly protein TadG